MKFTDKTIKALKIEGGKTEAAFWDEDLPGFGLRVLEGGTRTWFVQYRIGSKQRRMKIGRYPAMSCDKARELAKKVLAQTTLKQDPAAEKAENAARAHETFGALRDKYVSKRERDVANGVIRQGSLDEIKRHLERNVAGLNELRIDKITKRDCAVELAKMDESPVQKNRTRASLVKFFAWCVGEGYLDANPATYTNKEEETSRTRVLKDGELRKVWNALEQYGRREDRDGEGGDDYRDVVRLLMLTGARATEMGDLAWDEIDFDKNRIELPGERTKNGYPFVIPMSEPVRAILKARKQGDRKLVFGRGGEGGFSGWSKAKDGLDTLAGVTDWVIHDLRRTFSTKSNSDEIGVAPHVVEACLNHVSGGAKAGVAGVYNQYQYLSEKTAAFAQWADWLMAAVEGRKSNLVPLKKRG